MNKKFNEAMEYTREYLGSEDGGIIETVIIIAAMAVLCVGVVSVIGPKITAKTNEAASAIGESATYNSNN